MYEGSQSVIELLEKQKKTALSKGEIVMVFKKIIEDSERMGERMQHFETRMDGLETRTTSIEAKVDTALTKIDKISEIVSRREPTLFEKILALKDHKYFWFSIFLILGIMAGVLGVPLTSYTGIAGLFGS